MIEAHVEIVLYKVAGNSYKGKVCMPKVKSYACFFFPGVNRRYITLSLFSGVLSMMIFDAQLSSLIIVRYIYI